MFILPVSEIDFIANQDYTNFLWCSEIKSFLQPLLYIFERFPWSYIVYKDGSNCAAIVWSGNRSKCFLSCLVYKNVTVSQICSLIILFCSWMVFDPNYTPTVGLDSRPNCLSMKCMSMHDLPTPYMEVHVLWSPIMMYLNK
jgi:hypothetical protein